MNESAQSAERIRVASFGFCLPGSEVPLASLPLSDQERKRLRSLGQEFFHQSAAGSTSLMIDAARAAIDAAGCRPDDVGLVITAPSLIMAQGLEVPAVAVRATLGLHHAECINLSQGCSGIFRGLELAAGWLDRRRNGRLALVVTACAARPVTRNRTHGAFYWGDGGAALLLGRDRQPGLSYEAYAESAAERDWAAMNIPYGDAHAGETVNREDLRIRVDFASDRDQMAYIESEPEHFGRVLSGLLQQRALTPDQLTALFLPSVGRNRLPLLLGKWPMLKDRVASDFRYAHMGGVDTMLFLHRYITAVPPTGSWLAALTPAYTALWAGALFRT